jgi:hypothetical protein
MNPNPSKPVIPRRSKWPWLVLGMFLFLGSLAYGALSFLRVSSDTRALRDCLLQATASNWSKTIEVNVGSFTFSLARVVTAFIDIPAEARTALRAARGAEVAVYQRPPGKACFDMAALVSGADEVMADRGWERLVGAVSGHQLVTVYVPNKIRSPRNVRFCVAVVERGQLVVVSARSNLEPLMDLAIQKCSEATALTKCDEKGASGSLRSHRNGRLALPL